MCSTLIRLERRAKQNLWLNIYLCLGRLAFIVRPLDSSGTSAHNPRRATVSWPRFNVADSRFDTRATPVRRALFARATKIPFATPEKPSCELSEKKKEKNPFLRDQCTFWINFRGLMVCRFLSVFETFSFIRHLVVERHLLNCSFLKNFLFRSNLIDIRCEIVAFDRLSMDISKAGQMFEERIYRGVSKYLRYIDIHR